MQVKFECDGDGVLEYSIGSLFIREDFSLNDLSHDTA